MPPNPMTWLLGQRDESLFNSWEHCYTQIGKPNNLPKCPSDRQPETRASQLYIIPTEMYLRSFPFSLHVSYIDKTL